VILTIDVTDKEFQVTQAPRPKLDQLGQPRIDKQTKLPIWATQVVVTDEDGGEIISIVTVGEKPPNISVGDLAEVDGLIAHPWFNNNRSGVAYRAESIRVNKDYI
jgi:hypothetical protein